MSASVLYHGTSRFRVDDGIAGGGLRPQRGAPGVYLTDDPDVAREYAQQAVEIDAERYSRESVEGNEVVLFAIAMDSLDPSLLGPDDFELSALLTRGETPALASYASWRDVPWETSLEVCEQVAYAGRIPWGAMEIVLDGPTSPVPVAPTP